MTREPVHQPNRPTRLAFPLNWRPLAAAWQLLYLRQGPYRPDPSKSSEWNRGAYLVAGAGHCGACHTPRNALGAENRSDRFGGGEAEDWYAPALNAASPAPVPWTVDQLYAYLRTGYTDQHGFAAGPMQSVVLSLRKVSDADVHAIATYIASINGPRDPAARKRQTEGALSFAAQRAATVTGISPRGTTGTASAGSGVASGAALFAGACATCHHSGGGLPISRPVALGLSTPVNEPDPINFLRIVLEGVHPPLGQRGPIMPSFSGALTDPQIEALADYVRTQYSRGGRWTNVAPTLAKMRQQQTPTMESP
jgi:mono/diheme cytochrome c family protein